jgi:hypothetical protein
MKATYFLITFFLLTIPMAFSQIETPPRRNFNIGVSLSAVDGVGGSVINVLPSLDARYKGTSLHIAPSITFDGLGITQEIIPISKSFYNIYWIASGYYFKGVTNKNNENTNYNSAALFTGVKIYMGGHFYTEAQFGIGYTKYQSVSNQFTTYPASSAYTPYFQFGIGYNIYRNYPKPVVEDDE